MSVEYAHQLVIDTHEQLQNTGIPRSFSYQVSMAAHRKNLIGALHMWAFKRKDGEAMPWQLRHALLGNRDFGLIIGGKK